MAPMGKDLTPVLHPQISLLVFVDITAASPAGTRKFPAR